MNILVIRKVTNFELHGDRTTAQVESGHLSKDNLARLKQAHDEHYESLSTLRDSLDQSNIQWEEITRSESWPSKKFDFVITVGGDGTLLTASHKVGATTKLIGVKSSFSSVGFLCSYSRETVSRLVGDLVSDSLKFSQFKRLRATITHTDRTNTIQTEPVLNDFLFANKNPAATTRYKITLNNKNEFQKSSGIWVSTPVGSSAAIHAAGGIEQNPLEGHCQFKVRELYKPRGQEFLLPGSVFDPSAQKLSVENRNESAMLAIDGQHGVVELKFGDRIDFLNADPILLVSDYAQRALS